MHMHSSTLSHTYFLSFLSLSLSLSLSLQEWRELKLEDLSIDKGGPVPSLSISSIGAEDNDKIVSQ